MMKSRTAVSGHRSIRIPEPCHVDSSQMTPVDDDKFCASCSQVVTDFTKMTDAQLIDWMANHRGGCGSFRPDQLNRQLIAPNIRKAPFGMKWLLGLLVMTGCIRDADRKERIKPPVERSLGEPMLMAADSPERMNHREPPPQVKELLPQAQDSTFIMGNISISEPEKPDPVLPNLKLIDAHSDAEKLPPPLIDCKDSGFAVTTGEIASQGFERAASRGLTPSGTGIPAPDFLKLPATEKQTRKAWKRFFGRR